MKGTRVDDNKFRFYVMKTSDGREGYLCINCIAEIFTILDSKLNTTKTAFNWTLADITKYVDPNHRISRVGPDALRATMGRYEDLGRQMLKKIRTLEGRYTDRNEVCKDIREHLKNIHNAVELYLQKT